MCEKADISGFFKNTKHLLLKLQKIYDRAEMMN